MNNKAHIKKKNKQHNKTKNQTNPANQTKKPTKKPEKQNQKKPQTTFESLLKLGISHMANLLERILSRGFVLNDPYMGSSVNCRM